MSVITIILHISINLRQKQLSRDVLKKSSSENMQQTYKRTPVPKCDFNKVAFSRIPTEYEKILRKP